jgi:hypothetical protein
MLRETSQSWDGQMAQAGLKVNKPILVIGITAGLAAMVSIQDAEIHLAYFACLVIFGFFISWAVVSGESHSTSATLWSLACCIMSAEVLAAAYRQWPVNRKEDVTLALVVGAILNWTIVARLINHPAKAFAVFKRVLLVLALLVIASLLPVAVTGYSAFATHQANLHSLGSHYSEYSLGTFTDDSLNAPYIVGKLVVVDLSIKKIDDDVYSALPRELQATGPEEVRTIIWLKYDSVKVGSYSDGKSAFRQDCVVEIIDKNRGRIVGKQLVNGGPPPYTKNDNMDHWGKSPNSKIVHYLESLPRK